MIRIKLFALFIAYAMVALARPREMRNMLDAAEAGDEAVKRRHKEFPPLPDTHYNACGDGSEPLYTPEMMHDYLRVDRTQECPLPPAGWRCTRRAGHDGPCAAVVK